MANLQFGFNLFRGALPQSMRQAVSVAGQFFGVEENQKKQQARRTMLSLMRTILEAGGEPLSRRDLELFRQILSSDHSPAEIDRLSGELQQCRLGTAADAIAAFQPLPAEEKENLIRSLLDLAAADDSLEPNLPLLAELSAGLGVEQEKFNQLQETARQKAEQRGKILRSGAGVLAAIVVLAVFILTATLLRSVIFGLIGAYLLLPVEKFFESRLRRKSGLSYLVVHSAELLFSPLDKLAGRIRRATGTAREKSPEERQRQQEQKRIKQAVALTSVLLIFFFCLFGSALSGITGYYIHSWENSVRDWSRKLPASPVRPAPAAPKQPSGNLAAPQRESELAAFSEKILTQSGACIESLRRRFEKTPLVQFGLKHLEQLLQNPEAQKEVAGMLLRRTGGLFSFTAGVLGNLAALLADLLLTIFFFLLFLLKLAEFCPDRHNAERQSEYLVRTVFNGSWLPGATEETIAGAQQIIGGVIARLRVWVRGYLTLMCIDGTVYTTIFFLLGLPYFPLLGILAGCGILLPYVGPIISCVFTLLVTLAAGGAAVSGTQLLLIIIAYLCYNGVIEQFILYPAVIGDSLGLTTLETIIVVLLGAIFAGIPGMLLALPAASVIKYLVPQIYNQWGHRHGAAGN